MLNSDQWRALREALDDGCSNLHRGIEAAAVRDSVRQMDGSALQDLARGIEVLGKAVWILNELRLGSVMPTKKDLKKLGHHLAKLREVIVKQVALLPDPGRYDQAFLASDPLLIAVIELAEDFADQGRYRHLTSLVVGAEALPMHMAWNMRIENTILAEPGAPRMVPADATSWSYLRRRHVELLQRLLRSLARQALDAQVELGAAPVAHRNALELLAGIPDASLAACAAMSDACPCLKAERRVAVLVER